MNKAKANKNMINKNELKVTGININTNLPEQV
jgi:hypothetical protein